MMRNVLWRNLLVFLVVLWSCVSRADEQTGSPQPLRVFAAGSLSGVVKSLVATYEKTTGQKIDTVFGPAGLLLDRIEKDGGADLFLSANMNHPEQLARAGKSLPPVIYVRNAMCGLARKDFGLTTENFLQKLLDPATRIGTSTPKADPGGDYAWMMFARADVLKPGAGKLLEDKAQKLVGGTLAPPPAAGANPVAQFVKERTVDLFIGYCSHGSAAPDNDLVSVRAPDDLNIAVDYGMSVIEGADPERQWAAARFALYLLTPGAQKIFADFGFVPVEQSTQN